MTHPANDTTRPVRAWQPAAGALALTLGLGACDKPKPPPAPPPPPPPAPRVEAPPPVSFEGLAQELRIDARVQLEQGLIATDEGLARATLRVADAIAKGDAKALRAVLSQRAGDALGTLESSDLWAPATKGIEAVRVLSVAQPPANLVAGSDPELTPADAGDLTKLTAYMLDRFPAATHEKLKPLLEEAAQKALADGGGATNPAELKARILAALAAQGFAPKRDLKVFSASATHAVLMAVQDSGGAYLTGWQATKNGDSWVFDGVATISEVRPRAASWTGIGSAAFDLGGAAALAAATAPKSDPKAAGADGQPSDAATPAAPQDVKRTPAGPVRIPRPGG